MAEVQQQSGTTVKDVNAQAFIEKYAQHLKRQGKMEIPQWVDIVKTATHKELAPYSPDWYYVRAASVARKIYLRPHVGVGALARWYGGRMRRGTRTEHFNKANGGLIRHILQQLEKIKVVEQGNGKGRVITRIGQQDLDRIAGQLKEEEKEAAEEEEEEEDEAESEEESEESESEEEDSDDE